jgi:hypothetical protein
VEVFLFNFRKNTSFFRSSKSCFFLINKHIFYDLDLIRLRKGAYLWAFATRVIANRRSKSSQIQNQPSIKPIAQIRCSCCGPINMRKRFPFYCFFLDKDRLEYFLLYEFFLSVRLSTINFSILLLKYYKHKFRHYLHKIEYCNFLKIPL